MNNIILNQDRVGIVSDLLKEGRILRFIEAHNGISALIADDISVTIQKNGKEKMVEYDGFWESSLTDSASKGLPDIEIVSLDSRLETIGQILEVTHKPIIVDGDTGGDFDHFEYMVKRMERNGVSMVIIEDKVFPKRNSLEPGTTQELEDPEIFCEKIRRGQAVKINKKFLIIARIESLIAGLGQKEAITRAKAYLKAGADGIFIHSKKDNPAEVVEFAQAYKKLPPDLIKGKALICVPTTYNTITEDELEREGFNIVIYANHMLRASYAAMKNVAREILVNGRSFEVNPLCAPVKEIFGKVGFLEIKEKDKATAEKFKSKIKVIIPAAGKDPLSEAMGCPRSLIAINGKTILEHQLKTLKKAGLNNTVIIKGYKEEMFGMENITYCKNCEYETKGIAASLLCARDYLKSPFVYLNSDILFNEDIIRNLVKLEKTNEDIVLVVDSSYQYHKHRLDKELDLVVAKNKEGSQVRRITDMIQEELVLIGKKIDKNIADYEFIGMAYFSEKGGQIMKEVYEDSLNRLTGRFHESDTVASAGFTDLIQEIVERGYRVRIIKTHKGWMEIHNQDDISLAEKIYKHD
jgi:phosphoenolpyruvate phosphomutase